MGPLRAGEDRPSGEALQVEKLDPKLEKILKEWETETAKIKKLQGDFDKFSYDNTFSVENRAQGSFKYEAPDKGVYEVHGAKISQGMQSRRNDAKGRPFQLKTDQTEQWFCTGDEIFQINDGERTYRKTAIPEQSRGQNIIDGPLPFLFGMKAVQAKRRYKLTLRKETDTEIWIHVVPKLQHDQANYSEATVILDRTTYLPKGVRLLDPPQTKETVHVFKNMKTRILHWPLDDPFKPNLFGYKWIQDEKKEVLETDPAKPRSRSLGLSGLRNSTPPRTATNEGEDGASAPPSRTMRKPSSPPPDEEQEDSFPKRKSNMM